MIVHIRLLWLVSCSIYRMNYGMIPLEKLTDHLKFYELLSPSEYDRIENTTHLLFIWSAFERHFKALLWPAQHFVSRDIRITIADGKQLPSTSSLIPTLYKGKLMNEAASHIVAHENLNGEISMTIISEFGTLIVQSASLVLPRKYSTYLLIYRLEDVRNPNISLLNDIMRVNIPLKGLSSDNVLRTKRSRPIDVRRFCGVIFVADFSFFDKVAGRKYVKVIELLVKQFDKVNEIFLSTEFIGSEGRPLKGYGMFLQSILIDTKPPTNKLSNRTPEEILKDFSRRDLGKSCLAHLFTFSPDSKGVLGYTWPAYLAPGKEGGICSDLFYPPSGPPMRVNTGYTSFANEEGHLLREATAMLITAHELGHSWGAFHDPAGNECAPSVANGGQYLMFPHALSGYSPNNYKFSKCSRRSIGAVLELRSDRCFVDDDHIRNELCGNSRIDSDEECDPGRFGANKCCSNTCKLTQGARCSPSNHRCCTEDCQIAPQGTACDDGVFTPCMQLFWCNGLDRECELRRTVIPFRCPEHGFCKAEDCLPFCTMFGLKTCICDKAEFSCLICCAIPLRLNGEEKEVCRPIVMHELNKSPMDIVGTYSPSPKGWEAIPVRVRRQRFPVKHTDIFFLSNMTNEEPMNDLIVMHLDNNRPCPYGVCMSGVCQELRARSTNQVEKIVQQVVDYKKVRYIWANSWGNIVVIILCLAAVVWVPLSILVNSYDVQLEESRRHLVNLLIFNKHKPPAIVLKPIKRTRRRTL